MTDLPSWIATGATIFAACLTASNLGSRITGYGFIVFTIGSIAWLVTGIQSGHSALIWTNVAMTFLNLFGVWRWLGRQATVEDGASKATQKSQSLPTETLFPASSLASARVLGKDGVELGTTVDAMIGYRTGKLGYLVMARGGLAGIGEVFRRLDWKHASVHEGRVQVQLTDADVARLPQLDKDNWPGR